MAASGPFPMALDNHASIRHARHPGQDGQPPAAPRFSLRVPLQNALLTKPTTAVQYFGRRHAAISVNGGQTILFVFMQRELGIAKGSRQSPISISEELHKSQFPRPVSKWFGLSAGWPPPVDARPPQRHVQRPRNHAGLQRQSRDLEARPRTHQSR